MISPKILLIRGLEWGSLHPSTHDFLHTLLPHRKKGWYGNRIQELSERTLKWQEANVRASVITALTGVCLALSAYAAAGQNNTSTLPALCKHKTFKDNVDHCSASHKKILTTATPSQNPPRRAKPAPFDAIFPSSEYLGPTIGAPNTDPIYPLNKAIWKLLPGLKDNDIRIYGWVNPSMNISTSHNSNIPLSYDIVSNRPELDQWILRIDRTPNTVQTDHVDWGFRLSNLYGIDYRYTTAQGIFSNQLLRQNNLYGYDPVEAYGQFYFPQIAEGMVLTFGRYISPPDIEAQLAPQNYLFTHSLMFTVDIYTMTGANAAVKLNNDWTILLGVHTGGDVAAWSSAAHIPTGQAMVRWVSQDNNNSLWGGIDSINDGDFKASHDNLQEFNVTWTHRFTPGIHTATEGYYLYQYDAVKGGTCNFGPIRYFGGGGGCGAPIPGKSPVWGGVNYTELKISPKDFISVRTDYLNDVKGERTGFATQYMSYTLGVTHQFSPLIEIRPEIRYEWAFSAKPYDNGTQKDQTTFDMDMIARF